MPSPVLRESEKKLETEFLLYSLIKKHTDTKHDLREWERKKIQISAFLPGAMTMQLLSIFSDTKIKTPSYH